MRASIILPVIASERSERGNLNGIANDGQNTQLAIQGDCHAVQEARLAMTKDCKSLKTTRDCHESAYTDSRNDSIICHTEGVARSISKEKQERYFANAQYDKNSAIASEAIAKQSNPTKSLKISFCLASALFASSALLETAAALCVGPQIEDSSLAITCKGVMDSTILTSALNRTMGNQNQRSTINLGGNSAGDRLVASGTGSPTTQFEGTGDRIVIFRGVEAGQFSFDFSFSNTSGSKTIYMTYANNDWTSRIGTLKVSNKTSGAVNTYIRNGSIVENSVDLLGNNDSSTGAHNLYITGSAQVGKITGNFTNLTIGDRGNNNSAFFGSTDFSAVKSNLTINNITVTIRGNATSFNSSFVDGSNIKVDKNTRLTVANGTQESPSGIFVSGEIGQIDENQVYLFDSFIQGVTNKPTLRYQQNIFADNNFRMQPTEDGRGFVLLVDLPNSYGVSAYRALAISNMRRNTMTQNILDTMTTKTFHSDRFYNQEVELRLLQYDMSRLTNRSSKFSKQTRKNQKKVDKVRERIAKLTLEQSKGQNLDKGYNNFEVIDQLDAIFIPYTGRRDWRFFALPYATHTYGFLGANESMEYAGGALFGVQRNLRAAGIFGGYVGYEFANTDTNTSGADTRVQTHSLQLGANYFKTFAITSKVWEGFIKANIRGGVDLPDLRFVSGSSTLKIQSNEKASSIPLMYNIGAEVKGGVTFYQFRRNSYIAPAVSLSYDMLSVLGTKLIKPQLYVGNALTPGNDEFYNSIFWHLPQLGVDVRYYKMWGNTFRTNLKAGIKYNMLNTQQAFVNLREHRDNKTDNGSKYGASERASTPITLPAVYGNVAFDLIWMVKKNHELSFGYDGLFFASSFAKEQGLATNDWFNGVTTTLNFKYAYWFGGSDYVTDKDGNAVARSIAEGGKKSKKSKKPKKKKTKKKKSKVVYIDG